jgi:dTDP-4-dehydrorhamnose reductase
MWLLVGGDSEIGGATCAHLRARGRPVLTTTRRPEGAAGRLPLDLAGDLAGWEPPPGIEAACIFAAAARLAACEADPAGSARVNVTGTLALTERLLFRGIHVLFLSTNQVFDGWTPHVPADAPTAPVSEYGRQKARTEAGLRAHLGRGAAILRLAKVVSPHTALLRDWAAALAAGKAIRAFHDMTMAPAAVDTVAHAVEALMSDRASGIFQLTGPRDVAYADVGRFLAERQGADPALVTPTSVAEAGLPRGVAPANTTLDSSLMRERYGVAVPDAWEVLDEVSGTS